MRTFVAFALLASIACPLKMGVPQSNSIALPKDAHKLLDRQYPHWQLANVKTDGDCRQQMGDRPAEAKADVNTDGFDDWALWIHTSDGVRLVVVMPWLDGFQTIELEKSSEQVATRFLAIEKRGTSFTNPQTSAEDFFPNDTLVTRSCGAGRIAYFWQGSHFTKVLLPE